MTPDWGIVATIAIGAAISSIAINMWLYRDWEFAKRDRAWLLRPWHFVIGIVKMLSERVRT